MWTSLFSSRSISVDAALLVIRLGIGLSMLLFHGWGKLTGGAEGWERLGSNMAALGIHFAPIFWGLMAALAESIGSVLILLGVLWRPATAALAFTMVVAALRHLNIPEGEPGAGWKGASHALELLAVYVALFLSGPGTFTIWPGKRTEDA